MKVPSARGHRPSTIPATTWSAYTHGKTNTISAVGLNSLQEGRVPGRVAYHGMTLHGRAGIGGRLTWGTHRGLNKGGWGYKRGLSYMGGRPYTRGTRARGGGHRGGGGDHRGGRGKLLGVTEGGGSQRGGTGGGGAYLGYLLPEHHADDCRRQTEGGEMQLQGIVLPCQALPTVWTWANTARTCRPTIQAHTSQTSLGSYRGEEDQGT